MSVCASQTVSTPRAQRVTPASVTALLQCTNLGGMEKVAYSLLERLQERGICFNISTPRPWGLGRDRILRMDSSAKAFNYAGKFGWRSFSRFHRHIRDSAQGSGHFWVIGNCVSCLSAARQSGRKTIFSHHYHHHGKGWARLKWKAFYMVFSPGLDLVTYPTHFTCQEALRIAPWLKGKARVIRNGFDVHFTTEAGRMEAQRTTRDALGIAQDAYVIGNAGWLIASKRFDVFLQTAQEVARQIPRAEFFICGGGPEEATLRRLAQELGINRKVHFTGWVEDLTPHYQAWDAVLFNSDFEALGCTPLEAASHGCLSVASCPYGGLSEFLRNGETGYLFKEHATHQLAAALVTLARSKGLAVAMRQRAAAFLRQEFSQDASVRFYENCFRGRALPRRDVERLPS